MTENTAAMLTSIKMTHEELRQRMAQLAPKEREALELTARGLMGKEVASVMGCSEHSVAYYLRGARDGLGTDTIAESVALVWDLRLLALRRLIAETIERLGRGESPEVIQFLLLQGLQEQ